MKISLTITVVILTAFAAFGWRQQVAVAALRDEQAALRAEAVALGLSVDESAGGQGTRQRRSSHQRQEQAPADVNALTADVVQLLRDIKEGNMDESDTSGVERVSEIIERLYQLDAAQVRLLMDEFWKSAEIDDEARRNVIGLAILALAEKHPESAVALFGEAQDLLGTEGNISHRRDLLKKLVGSWAAKDPLAALDWVKKNEALDPALRDPNGTCMLIAGAARKNPALAFEWAAGLKGEELQEATMEIVKTARTPDAQREMLALLRGMAGKTAAERDEAMAETYKIGFNQIVKGMSEQGYEATQQWLKFAALDPAEAGMLANQIASSKPTEDTGKWLEWMGTNLPSEALNERITPLMTRWTDEDYRAAGDWLSTTPDGPVKQTAVTNYALRVAHYDPASAAQWAESLPSDKIRDVVFQNIHAEWKARDAAAADSFAAKHGLAR